MNLAEGMGDNKQSGYNKRILPKSSGEITHKNKINTKLYNHGNIKSYLHRFTTIDTPHCPWGDGNQTTDHILLECAILQEDRERLIAEVAKSDDWPMNKDMLIKKHYKAFAKFTKKMDKITEENT
jgi:hypothetical protein